MENLTIKIRSEDVAMLRRIAKATDRRFDDFLQIVFAEGLTYFSLDQEIYVKKLPEEYTEQERKQEELNKKIEAEDHDSYESRKLAGFVSIMKCFTNRDWCPETNTYSDNLIEPIVEKIKEIALS